MDSLMILGGIAVVGIGKKNPVTELVPKHVSAAEGRALLAKAQGHQPESIVLNQCRDYLRALGWYVVRIQQGMGCHRGVSDLIAIRDGRVLWIECKATRGKLSAFQETFGREIREHGGSYLVVHSLDEMIEQSKGEQ